MPLLPNYLTFTTMTYWRDCFGQSCNTFVAELFNLYSNDDLGTATVTDTPSRRASPSQPRQYTHKIDRCQPEKNVWQTLALFKKGYHLYIIKRIQRQSS
jgi:hypothetical protein